MAFLNTPALAVIFVIKTVNIVLRVHSKPITAIVLNSKHIRWCIIETHDTPAKQQDFTIDKTIEYANFI